MKKRYYLFILIVIMSGCVTSTRSTIEQEDSLTKIIELPGKSQ